MNNKKTNIVLFDFDGTLSASDANREFFKYCFRHSVRPWLFLPIILLGFIVKYFTIFKFKKYRVGAIDVFYREMMRSFLTGKMVKKFAQKFVIEHKKRRFGWAAQQVAKERSAGNFVICLSAGPDYLIDKLTDDMNFDAIICSIMDTRRPYKFDFLCWGDNKILALAENINMLFIKNAEYDPKTVLSVLKDVKIVRAYSDHPSDAPMMRLASTAVWIDPKTGLRKENYC